MPERIKEILAEVIPTLKDPRVGFVTVTDVRTTADFAKATIFYTVLETRSAGPAPDRSPARPPRSSAEPADQSADAVLPDERAETDAQRRTAEGLASAMPVLRRELGRRMRLRHVPELEFVHDPVPAHGRRIEALLDEARRDP